MKKKLFYEAPEVECILLIKESVMLNDSQFNNKSDDGYDSDNDLGTIG